ncbi:MAG: hypothetical protein PUJ01_03270, partial [Parabacteroides sp.]|nr:hypothetical protein [Parabacteroides sp.]
SEAGISWDIFFRFPGDKVGKRQKGKLDSLDQFFSSRRELSNPRCELSNSRRELSNPRRELKNGMSDPYFFFRA